VGLVAAKEPWCPTTVLIVVESNKCQFAPSTEILFVLAAMLKPALKYPISTVFADRVASTAPVLSTMLGTRCHHYSLLLFVPDQSFELGPKRQPLSQHEAFSYG